jgi:hypothetical protein
MQIIKRIWHGGFIMFNAWNTVSVSRFRLKTLIGWKETSMIRLRDFYNGKCVKLSGYLHSISMSWNHITNRTNSGRIWATLAIIQAKWTQMRQKTCTAHFSSRILNQILSLQRFLKIILPVIKQNLSLEKCNYLKIWRKHLSQQMDLLLKQSWLKLYLDLLRICSFPNKSKIKLDLVNKNQNETGF